MLSNWFRGPRFVMHPDSFVLSHDVQMSTLCQWIRQTTDDARSLLVLCHFRSTFLRIQDAFQHVSIDYDVLSKPVNTDELVHRQHRAKPRVELTLAEMLVDSQTDSPADNHREDLGIVVTERHPLLSRDERIEQFARNIPARVSLGYLLSFEDAIIKQLIGERFVQLMKQLGFGQNDLISSAMTSKAITKALRKIKLSPEDEQLAESPERWIELNLK